MRLNVLLLFLGLCPLLQNAWSSYSAEDINRTFDDNGKSKCIILGLSFLATSSYEIPARANVALTLYASYASSAAFFFSLSSVLLLLLVALLLLVILADEDDENRGCGPSFEDEEDGVGKAIVVS